MNRSRFRTLSNHLIPLAAAAMAAAMLLGSIGCETRVIRTENSWVGSQSGVDVVRVGRQREEEKDGLAGLGEFLFGWMDGEEEGGRVREVDLSDRMGGEVRQSGGGG